MFLSLNNNQVKWYESATYILSKITSLLNVGSSPPRKITAQPLTIDFNPEDQCIIRTLGIPDNSEAIIELTQEQDTVVILEVIPILRGIT